MQKKIKVETPAKINLSLEITDRLPNGFHSLASVMQTVSLYDYLTFNVSEIIGENQIILTGNSDKIPYNEKNIIYKVLKSYLDITKINGLKIEVDIDKNIPVEAGLAGGSTNAAGALIGINSILNNELPIEEIHKIAASAGSDLNFCLEGGACRLSSRGEIIDEKLPYREFNVALIKPKNISVSTGLCYKNFSLKYFEKKSATYTNNICEIFKTNFDIKKLAKNLYNDLEKPATDMYSEIQELKKELINSGCINSLMSGSGSSIFGLYENEIHIEKNADIDVFYVKSTKDGVKIL